MEKYLPFPCEGPNKSKMCIAKLGAPALPEFLPVGTLIRAAAHFGSNGFFLSSPRPG